MKHEEMFRWVGDLADVRWVGDLADVRWVGDQADVRSCSTLTVFGGHSLEGGMVIEIADVRPWPLLLRIAAWICRERLPDRPPIEQRVSSLIDGTTAAIESVTNTSE